jgi:DNA-binding LacI/PurR family transcriptional regulator
LCRSIHFVAGPKDAPVAQARLNAAGKAAADAGLEIRGITYADYSYAGGWQAAASILASDRRPDAIMCVNDAIALGVLDYCRNEIGLDVPGELAVTGYDDVPEGAWAAYRLTTLGQPHEALTQAAVRMACDRMEGTSPAGECRLFPARLLARGSTRGQAS